MMYKRKYTKGEKITSLDELVQQEFVYWHDKITHQGWVTSWQLRMACLAIQNGVIFKAIKVPIENEEVLIKNQKSETKANLANARFHCPSNKYGIYVVCKNCTINCWVNRIITKQKENKI